MKISFPGLIFAQYKSINIIIIINNIIQKYLNVFLPDISPYKGKVAAHTSQSPKQLELILVSLAWST